MVRIIRYPTPTKPSLRYARGQVGPPSKRTAGGWLADLAALDKAIVLCEGCTRKWEPKRYGFEKRKAVPGYEYVVGDCDGCGCFAKGFLFIRAERGTYGGPSPH